MAVAMQWFETTGGPYLILPASIIATWSGIYPTRTISDSPGPKSQKLEGNAPVCSDYDRVCSRTVDFVVRIGNREGLVIHSDGGLIAWYTDNKIATWLLAEVLTSDTQDYIARHGIDVSGEPWAHEADYTIADDIYLLIDSSCPGELVTEYLTVPLAPGEYRIEACVLDIDGVPAILHNFRPIVQ